MNNDKNMVVIDVDDYEELMEASVKLNVLHDLYPKMASYEFDAMAGALLGVTRP